MAQVGEPSHTGRFVEWRSLGVAMVVLAPLALAAVISGAPGWWRAMIATMAILIASERSGLAPLGVAAHGLAIAVFTLGLLASLATPLAFVAAVMLLAGSSVLLASCASKLRALGNWTFIPALYLACETAEGAVPAELLPRGLHFLPFIAAATLPVLALTVIGHGRTRSADAKWLQHFRRVVRWTDSGGREPAARAVLASVLAVGIAAALVEWQHLPHGQWVIWSAASVIAGEASAARRKLRDRTIGAMAGVPVGIGVSFLVPHDGVTYGITAIMALLTLVAFRTYVVAFAMRCACAALALAISAQSSLIAAERASNVLLGGAIGIAVIGIVHAVAGSRRFQRKLQTTGT